MDRFSQALTNLLANAIQHGSEKTPVRIAANGNVSEVTIAVHNDGKVIAREQLTGIFNPMKSAHGKSGGDRRHLGLGLYIVEKIVNAHDGTVAVESSKANGTVFTVKVPRRAANGVH